MKIRNLLLTGMVAIFGLMSVSCGDDDNDFPIVDIYPIAPMVFLVDENGAPLYSDFTVEEILNEGISVTYEGETYKLAEDTVFSKHPSYVEPGSRAYMPKFRGLVMGYDVVLNPDDTYYCTVAENFNIIFGEFEGAESSHHEMVYHFPKYNKDVTLEITRNFTFEDGEPKITDKIIFDGKYVDGQSMLVVTLPSTERVE